MTYETVLLRDRVPLHRAAAQWIETVAGDRVGEFRELIADHYLRADEPDARGVPSCSRPGSPGATRRTSAPPGAPSSAPPSSRARRASSSRPTAAIAMGEVCYRLGDVDVAQQTLDRVIDRDDDPATVAEALFWSSRIAEAAGDGPRERALLERALDLLEPVGGVTHARVLAALTRWEGNHGDFDAAVAIGERALRASMPDTVERTEAHSALGIIASLRGDADEADRHARLAAEAARATGNLQLQASVLANLGVYAHLRGDDGDDGAVRRRRRVLRGVLRALPPHRHAVDDRGRRAQPGAGEPPAGSRRRGRRARPRIARLLRPQRRARRHALRRRHRGRPARRRSVTATARSRLLAVATHDPRVDDRAAAGDRTGRRRGSASRPRTSAPAPPSPATTSTPWSPPSCGDACAPSRMRRPPTATRSARCPSTPTRSPRSSDRRPTASTPPSAAASTAPPGSLRNLGWFEVTDIRGHLEDGAVAHYQVTMKVGFRLDDD